MYSSINRQLAVFLSVGLSATQRLRCAVTGVILSSLLISSLQAAPVTKLSLVSEEFPPLQFQLDGQPKGYVIEFIRALVEEASRQHPMMIENVHFVPWKRAIMMASNDPNTLFFSVSRTPAREAKYHWIGEVSPYEVFLFKYKDGPELQPDNISQLQNFRLGLQGGGSFDDYFSARGFKPVTVAYNRQTIKMLRAGRIDYAPQVSQSFPYRLEEFGYDPDHFAPVIKIDDLSKQLWLVMSSQASPEVVYALQSAYTKLQADNTLNKLIASYQPDSLVMQQYRAIKASQRQ